MVDTKPTEMTNSDDTIVPTLAPLVSAIEKGYYKIYNYSGSTTYNIGLTDRKRRTRQDKRVAARKARKKARNHRKSGR